MVGFAIPADYRVTLKENEKSDKYIELSSELKIHESDGDTNYNWCTRYSHQSIGTRTGELGNKRTSGDDPNYSIIEIDQNSKKSPGNFRLADTQTPVENYLLMLV